MSQYESAAIEAEVTVYAYRKRVDEDRSYPSNASRTVKLTFRESFADDSELEKALEAFSASVKEAARR